MDYNGFDEENTYSEDMFIPENSDDFSDVATEEVYARNDAITGFSNEYSEEVCNFVDSPETVTYYAEPEAKPPVAKKERKMAGVALKIFATIGLGMLFGVFAAGTMYSVNYIIKLNETEFATPVNEQLIDAEALKDEITQKILASLPKNDSISYSSVDDMVVDQNQTVTTSYDVSNIAKEVMPSVVAIKSTYVNNSRWGSYGREKSASGSGIIIGENETELLVATNYHVIEDADSIEVQFIDDKTVEARVKGYDSKMDVAVIAINYGDIEPSTKGIIKIAELGDSDALQVGEPVIAIGNALGYGQSVTTGVVSAVNRKLEMLDGSYSEGLIQTDAAINPGNSGGALLNAKGQVIGINSNKIGGTTIEGMGYAIPISKAGPVLEELKNKKTRQEVPESQRGYLGIQGRGVSAEMSEIYGFPEGVYVYDVYPGTKAAKAGLRKGDIITKLDGSKVDKMETLQGYLLYYAYGETVTLTIMRTGEGGAYTEMELSFELVSKSAIS